MSHQLEYDGVSMSLFAYLAKPNRKMETARVFVPHTVVFDHGFASAWYYSTPQMEIKKRNEREISSQEIYTEFSALSPTEADCDVVAAFLSSPNAAHQFYLQEVSPVSIETTYFDKKALHEFLYSPGEKPRGILQKFVYPKGLCVTTIQAIWSKNVTLTEAVRNPHSLRDKTKSIGERAGTFEVSVAQQISTTNSVNSAICRLCALIVQHLEAVDHIAVQGMVLQFRVDENNRVMLLYATSMRVAKTDSTLVEHEETPPLNLLHNFVGEKQRNEQQAQKEMMRVREAKMKRKKAATPQPSAIHLKETLDRLGHKPEMANSTVYKNAALRLLERSPQRVRSRLVLPALLGAVHHNGKKWVSTGRSPQRLSEEDSIVPSAHHSRTVSETSQKDREQNESFAKEQSQHREQLHDDEEKTPQRDSTAGSPTSNQSNRPTFLESEEDSGDDTGTKRAVPLDDVRRSLSELVYLLESAFLSCSRPTLKFQCVFEEAFFRQITATNLDRIFLSFNIEFTFQPLRELAGLIQKESMTVFPLATLDLDLNQEGEDRAVVLCSFSCPLGGFPKALAAVRWQLSQYLKHETRGDSSSPGRQGKGSMHALQVLTSFYDKELTASESGTSFSSQTTESKRDSQAPAPSSL